MSFGRSHDIDTSFLRQYNSVVTKETALRIVADGIKKTMHSD
jgi:hypothetical protein